MEPIRTATTTSEALGPEGSDILPLPLERLPSGYARTVWTFDAFERAAIAAGWNVEIVIQANVIFPMAVSVTDDAEFDPLPEAIAAAAGRLQ